MSDGARILVVDDVPENVRLLDAVLSSHGYEILQATDGGTAVIIVSTELDEIFALSDRIAVMYDGRIVDTVRPDIAREEIGLLMAGAQGAAPVEGGTHV